MKKRFLSLALTLCMILALMPMTVQAAMPDSVADGEGEAWDGVDFDALMASGNGVYYGTYKHATSLSSTTFGTATLADTATPVLWNIMGEEAGGGAITLLSEYVLDSSAFKTTVYAGDNVYDVSTIKNKLGTMADDMFNNAEDEGAVTTDVVTGMYDYSNGDHLTGTQQDSEYPITSSGQTLYLPRGKVNDKTVYWTAGNDTSVGQLSASAATLKDSSTNVFWWLRSPDSDISDSALSVGTSGNVYSGGVVNALGVRPAFKLNPESVIFTSEILDDATGALGATESDSTNYIADEDGAKNFKLTVLNSSLTAPGFTGKSNGDTVTMTSGGTLELTNTASITGKLVYKIVDRDSGTIVGYGVGDATDLTVASTGLTAGGDYTLYVWAQKDNDINSHEASEPMYFTLEVEPTYEVTVKGSYARTTGAGSYAEDDTVTINAGTRSSYTFNGWTSDDVTFTDASSATTTFTMPGKAVTVTAAWTYTGGNNSGGGTTTTTQATTPIGGVDINYSVDSKGAVTLKPTSAQLDELLGGIGADGVLSIALSDIDGMKSAIIEIDLTKLIASDRLQTFDFSVLDMKLSFPAGALESMRRLASTLRFGLKPGSVIFELTDASGKAIAWYDYANPVTVSMGYTSPMDISTHQLVMINEDGKIIPRSWYTWFMGTPDGIMSAKVHSAGTYDVEVSEIGSFTDTKGLWMDEAVGYMAARGIVNGVGDGLFGIDGTITRAEFVTMLMRALDVQIISSTLEVPFTDFEDIPDWAAEHVLTAKALGLTLTDENRMFNPNAPITRQDMFFMAYQAMDACGMLPEVFTEQWIIFSDWDGVEADYGNAIQNLCKLGLVSGGGDGTLNPNGSSSRAEGAQFLYNILKYDAR